MFNLKNQLINLSYVQHVEWIIYEEFAIIVFTLHDGTMKTFKYSLDNLECFWIDVKRLMGEDFESSY